MAKRRTGIDPLAYMGVEPSTPAQFVVDNRDPTTNDYDNFNLQAVWLNKSTHGVWMLVDKANFVATWIQFTSNISAVNTLTGNAGGAVPATAGNIDVIGASPYVFTGNPGTSTLTLDDDGTIATIYDTDSGLAIPSANILNVIGGTGVTVSGAGNTVTISASSSNLEILTDLGVPVSPTGSILQVLGGDNITTTGIAPNIIEAAVSGTTDHAIQLGNTSGSLTSVGPLITGQLLIGVSGSDPNPARLTAGSNITIDDITVPGEITISATGGGGGGDGCSILTAQTGTNLHTSSGISYYSTDEVSTPSNAVENQFTATETGQFSDMFVYISGNSSTVDTTVTLNVNSVNTSIVVTIPALTTGIFSDTTHTANVNQGDLIQFEASQSAVGSTQGVITITFNCAGSGGAGSVKVTTFNSSDTWVKDSQSKWIKVQIIGSGCGGGSGRQGISGAACGGNGGNILAGFNIEGPASTFPATTSVVIGAGGLGASSIMTPNTDGNNGALAGNCSFGNLVTNVAGLPYWGASNQPLVNGGRGGTATGTPGTTQSLNPFAELAWYNGNFIGGASGNGSPTNSPTQAIPWFTVSSVAGTAGGCGAPAYTISPLRGSDSYWWIDVAGNTLIAQGYGGIESGTIDGGNGNTSIGVTSTYCNLGGTGGGGGGGQSQGLEAGNGGDGGYPGGAGGGGGGSLNGTNSGAGGDGADGIIYVYEFL